MRRSFRRRPPTKSTGRATALGKMHRRGALLLLLGTLAGCETPRQRLRTEPSVPVVETPAQPTPAPSPATQVVEPEPVLTPPAVEPLRVALLLSEDVPAYGDVARALAERLDPASVTLYDLEGKSSRVPEMLTRIQGSDQENVVAIGLLAAEASRRLTEKKVVFCQVFNFLEQDLVSPNRHGIEVLPPPGRLFQIWKEISPDLHRIGVIAGEGHRNLLDDAQREAAQQGLELAIRVVSSDKEAEYEFRRLLPRIEGLWLLPDNRVLSRDVLRQIMSYSRAYQKQVLVNNHQLLAMGGLLSISARSDEIANAALSVLEKGQDADQLQGPALTPLTQFDLRINGTLAQALGLTVPSTYHQNVEPGLSR